MCCILNYFSMNTWYKIILKLYNNVNLDFSSATFFFQFSFVKNIICMKIVRKKMLLFFITVLKIQFSIESDTFKSLLTSVATAWLGRRTILHKIWCSQDLYRIGCPFPRYLSVMPSETGLWISALPGFNKISEAKVFTVLALLK